MGNGQSTEVSREGIISINIRATDDSDEPVVDLEGKITQIVTEEDLAAFGLPMDELKNVIKRRDNSIAEQILFKTPATVRGFMKITGEAECIKTIKPINYTITKKETKTLGVSSRTLKNRSQVTGNYTIDMSHTETNTFHTKWSYNATVNGNLKVEHNIITPKSAELSFSSYYGSEEEKSSTMTVVSNSGVNVELAPGQEAVSKITLRKHVYEIEIEYEATLSGLLVAVWDTLLFRFFYYDIRDLMRTANVNNKSTFKEIIKMDYFSDGEIDLSDPS